MSTMRPDHRHSRPTRSDEARRRQSLLIGVHNPIHRAITKATQRPDAIFVITLVCLVASRLAVTLPFGTFGHAGDPIADLTALVTGRSLAPSSAEVAWLRDYADIAIIVLVSIHTAHMFRQWDRLAGLPMVLREAGLLARTFRRRDVFEELVGRYARHINSTALEFLALASALVVGALVAGLPEQGIYSALGDVPTSVDRFHGWWANPISHPAAYGVLIGSFVLYLYLTFRHGLVGVVMLGLIWEARNAARRTGQPLFGYQSPFGEYTRAIKTLRAALWDVLISITLLVLAFTLATLYVSIPTPVVALLLVPFMVLNPLFLVVPLLHLNGRLRESREALISSTEHELRLVAEPVRRAMSRRGRSKERDPGEDPEGWVVRLESAREALAAAKALPAFVVDTNAFLRWLAIYVVPALGLLVSIARG